jgi:hypothetical protein
MSRRRDTARLPRVENARVSAGNRGRVLGHDRCAPAAYLTQEEVSMQRLAARLTLIVTMLALLLAPLAPAKAATNGFAVAVKGKAKNGPSVTGTFTIREFVKTGDPANPIGAVGTLVLTTATGQTAVAQATMPVKLGSPAAPAGASIQLLTCEILELTLGPLDLNLLGLEIHLDTVHLVIEANPAGGLLGQLLCAVANLLSLGDILAVLDDLIDLLNQILDLL